MPSSTIRTVALAVNTIDQSAVENLEAIKHRLKDGGIKVHLSEVKGPGRRQRAGRNQFAWSTSASIPVSVRFGATRTAGTGRKR
jgi:hypothetical protein